MITDDKYIDKSQQIPVSEVRKYAEYARDHGRKVFNNGMILPSASDKPTVDWLCDDAGILEGYHRDIGIKFKALCDSAEGKIIVAPVMEESDEAPIDQTLRIAAVYHQLTKNDKKLVCMILFEEMRMKHRRGLFHISGKLQNAFEALFRAMKKDNIIGAISAIQQIELAKTRVSVRLAHGCTATGASKFSSPQDESLGGFFVV